MKPQIVITRRPPVHIINELNTHFHLDIWDSEEEQIPRDVLLRKIENADGVLCLITENMDKEVMEKGRNLKVISNLAVGYNNIDVLIATQRGIQVTNTPGVLTETTADLTFALMLATSRRLGEASELVKKGGWKNWSPMFLTGMDIHGKTLGIIGLGDIGAAVAKRAKGFNMRVLYHNRSAKPSLEKELEVQYTTKNELLRESDFVCVLTPFNKETENMITLNEFKMMKKTAVLINTSRGGIVNEEDLRIALTSGEIWAAGLDVFEQEPVSMDHPLLQLPNVLALPHIGSASVETRTKMWELAARNLTFALTGKTPPNLVNE